MADHTQWQWQIGSKCAQYQNKDDRHRESQILPDCATSLSSQALFISETGNFEVSRIDWKV